MTSKGSATEDLRVVLISFSKLPTMQKYLYYAFDELRSFGVEVWTLGSSSFAIDFDLSKRNFLVDTPDSPKPSLGSMRMVLSSARELASRIAALKPDLIHFVNKHTWNLFLIRAIRRVLPGVKIVHTFHDPVGHDGDSVQKGVILYHKVVQRMLDGIVVHSDMAFKQVRTRLRPKCPVYQAPLGVVRWRTYDPPRASCKEVLIFGRINSYKGVRLYPEILRSLYEVDPEIRVVVAGKPADDIEPALLDEVNFAPNSDCHFGFVEEEDLDGYFADCSVVLMPYTSITQSGVVLDAYSHSRCVVAFGIDGINQYVPNTDLLIRPFDCPLYALKIAELMSDPVLLEAYSRGAWEFGSENYAPGSMAGKLLDIYLDAVDGGRS